MTHIEWTDDYKLGLPAIDSDHEQLLGLCNDFLDAAQAGSPIQKLAATLEQLIVQTRAHFLAEERMLDRHGYPGLAIHKAEHERLLTQAETLKARYDNTARESEQAVTVEIADFLKFWLLDHIRTNDRSYRPFLRSLA